MEKAKALREKVEAGKDRGAAARREVELESLIIEGKGRVKKGLFSLGRSSRKDLLMCTSYFGYEPWFRLCDETDCPRSAG